jgi:hypothetical protein
MVKKRIQIVWQISIIGLLSLVAISCKSEKSESPAISKPEKGAETMRFSIQSSAFLANADIPKKYTGDGPDVSPALVWTGEPEDTREFVLIMDDPDAPSAQPWVHWVIYKIPAHITNLLEGIPAAKQITTPIHAFQGLNSWNTIGYRGPAPPVGHGTHHYYFKLYALDAKLDIPAGLDKAALLKAIERHVLAEAELIGTYQR